MTIFIVVRTVHHSHTNSNDNDRKNSSSYSSKIIIAMVPIGLPLLPPEGPEEAGLQAFLFEAVAQVQLWGSSVQRPPPSCHDSIVT